MISGISHSLNEVRYLKWIIFEFYNKTKQNKAPVLSQINEIDKSKIWFIINKYQKVSSLSIGSILCYIFSSVKKRFSQIVKDIRHRAQMDRAIFMIYALRPTIWNRPQVEKPCSRAFQCFESSRNTAHPWLFPLTYLLCGTQQKHFFLTFESYKLERC